MNQREDFEEWWKEHDMDSITFKGTAWSAWQAAQAAKDAELQELRANLAKCRHFMILLEQWSLTPVNILHCPDYKAAKEACQ